MIIVHKCKWWFEEDAHHRAAGFTSISSRPTNHRTVANPPKQLENNLFWAFLQTDSKPTHDVGVKSKHRVCYFNLRGTHLHVVHDDLEEPSQSAALLLHSRIHFTTTKTHAKRWHLSSLWKLAWKPAVRIWRVRYEAVFEGYRVNKAKEDKIKQKLWVLFRWLAARRK